MESRQKKKEEQKIKRKDRLKENNLQIKLPILKNLQVLKKEQESNKGKDISRFERK